MKKIFINLITIPLVYAMPCICQSTNELYVAVPTTFEIISSFQEKITFFGLKDISIVSDIDGYNTITLIQSIQVLKQIAKSYKDNRLDKIVRFDYEYGSKLEEIYSGAISGLINLKQIFFPPSLQKIGRKAIVNCPNINELDFSEFESDKCFISPYIFDLSNPSQINSTGTVYVKNNKIKDIVEIKFHSVDCFKNWIIKIK